MALLLAALILSSSAAHSTSITIPYTFVPNTTIVSAQVNANFSIIASVVNGNIDNSNIAAGANISLSKLNNTQSIIFLESSSGVIGVGVGQTGDTVARVGMYSDGSLRYGPGSATVADVGLSRSNTNTIQLNNGTLNTGTGYLDMTYGIVYNAPLNAIPGGRLYMTTSLPYADHAAATTIFYGPATANTLLINNGTGYIYQTFAEMSFSVGALATGMYDIYIKSATPTTIATPTTAAWGGLNTPPTRTTDNYGRLCKSADTTSLLVGVVWINGSNQAEDDTSIRSICNSYNTIRKPVFAQIPVASWAPSGSTWGATNANTTYGQGRVGVVSLSPNLSAPDLSYTQPAHVEVVAADSIYSTGIGLDSTSAPSSNAASMSTGTASISVTIKFNSTNSVRYSPTSLTNGFHYFQMLENATAAGGTGVTAYGNGATIGDALTGTVWE